MGDEHVPRICHVAGTRVLVLGCVYVPKVLGCIAPQAYPIPLAMNVSPSEKTNNFLQMSWAKLNIDAPSTHV